MSGEIGLWVVVIVILTCVLSEGNLLGDHIFNLAITSIWNELLRKGHYYRMTQNIYHNHHFLSPPLTNQSYLPVVMFLKTDHFDIRSYMKKISRIVLRFIFIGPESDHWLCLPLTNSLTHSLLFSGLNGCEWYQLLDDVRSLAWCLMLVNDDAVWAVYDWQRPSNLSAGFTTHISSW